MPARRPARGVRARVEASACHEASTRDAGSVTVELAVALPAVVLVLGLVLGAIGWARSGVEASQAAGMGARLVAVEGDTRARSAIEAASPGARVEISRLAGHVTVSVVIDGPGWLPAATGTATAMVEP